MKSIADALEQRKNSPRGIAFLDADGEKERWTFGELGEMAHQACGALSDLGVSSGDRVGILGSTSPELVARSSVVGRTARSLFPSPFHCD